MADDIRVLHLDDDPDFAALTAEFLHRGDDRFSVETVTSGADALAHLTPAFDCVISDYDMPGMNGLEFLEAVREEYPMGAPASSSLASSSPTTDGPIHATHRMSGTDSHRLSDPL